MDPSLQFLSKVMDATALRQRVLANNLANADTPRFTRQDVKFKDMLTKAVQSGDADKVSAVQPEIVKDTVTGYKPDGNNVSLQRELGEMAENALLYQFTGKAVEENIDMLRRAIKGR